MRLWRGVVEPASEEDKEVVVVRRSSFTASQKHILELCQTAGVCSVTQVLRQCGLQGGLHHTQVCLLTYMGKPLQLEYSCYPTHIQWFRSSKYTLTSDSSDFQLLPDLIDSWFIPTADDINTRILAKVAMEDASGNLETKMLELGPMHVDPEVRSKVESYLDRQSILFMGVQSVSTAHDESYSTPLEADELWTLLLDKARLRLSCESSLLPPFEMNLSDGIQVDFPRAVTNDLCLHVDPKTCIRLRVESNIIRDAIGLTLRAFATASQDIGPHIEYSLPWKQSNDQGDSDKENTVVNAQSTSLLPGEINDTLLLDAEALIGTSAKMGLTDYHPSNVISISDVANLHIVSDDEMPLPDTDKINEQVERFHFHKEDTANVSALKQEYTKIFCYLQHQLAQVKQDLADTSFQMEEMGIENSHLKTHLVVLEDALKSRLLSDEASAAVSKDVRKLMDTELMEDKND